MNSAILIGRLTKDPELRYTTNNTPVCGFTLAVDRVYKQEGQPDADFIPVVAWSKLAETCGKYLKKGRRIAIRGRIQTRSYDDKDGQKVYVTEIVAEEMNFADDKKDDNGSSTPPAQQQQTPPPQQGGSPPAGNSNLPPWMQGQQG